MAYPNHNDAFLISMSHKAIAKDCFANHLPATVQKRMALDTMVRDSDILPGRLQNHLVDLLYRVKLVDEQGNIMGNEGFLWLICEHKSSPDPLLPLQLNRYRDEIWENWRKQQKRTVHHLPPIWGLVYYHGKEHPYPHSTDIRDCFADPELARLMFDEPHQLVDLSQISDEALKQHGLASGFQLLQKHIWDRENWTFLKEWLQVIKPIAKQVGDPYLLQMLQYLGNRGTIENTEHFKQMVVEVLPEYEDAIMSLAQQWRKEGREEGKKEAMIIAEQWREEAKKEGKKEGMLKNSRRIARRLLASGQRPDFVMDITGLSLNEIRQLDDEH